MYGFECNLQSLKNSRVYIFFQVRRKTILDYINNIQEKLHVRIPLRTHLRRIIKHCCHCLLTLLANFQSICSLYSSEIFNWKYALKNRQIMKIHIVNICLHINFPGWELFPGPALVLLICNAKIALQFYNFKISHCS